MSNFYEDISKDERDDWRKHHITQLAIAMLKEHAGDVERDALTAVRDGVDGTGKVKAGEADGIRFCINLLESE